MTIALIVIGVLAAVVIAVVAIGAALPVKHVARARSSFKCSVTDAWRRLAAFSEYPRWRRGLRNVEQAGPDAWKEVDSKGESITYQSVEVAPPRRLVRRINDKNLPYGGCWIIELEAAGDDQVAITITEEGEVYNPIFRFVSRFLMGHHATIRAFLEDFGASVGQRPDIQQL